jgi:hypothetical protein
VGNDLARGPSPNPAFRALHHTPSGQPPDFLQGIASTARPVFCTAIRLLTEHAFTGEYNARHRPRAPDLHDCLCGLVDIQTPSHVIFDCPRFRDARERILRQASPTLSPNIIFGTKSGGEALSKFIEITQACVRPRKRRTTVRSHGQGPIPSDTRPHPHLLNTRSPNPPPRSS